MPDLERLIADLHDSEINGEIGWFYDSVWSVKVKLGDMLHGYDAEDTFHSLEAAVEWMRAKAVELYPNSRFAKQYRKAFE
jgi:hypothetical protein